MDYLSRLVGGSNASPTRQAGYDTAQQRSIRFKRAHDQLQQIWRKTNASNLLVSAVSVLTSLESIKQILEDEVLTPAPHLCARHVSTFQTYMILVQVSSNYNDELIIHETLDIFKILIDSEEVAFLEETGYADALVGFVGKLSTVGASIDTENKIAEVLFGVASRIRLQPQILPTWFRPRTKTLENSFERGESGNIGNADKDVFPLCYLILSYVHHNGKVGDFLRTALIYIIESAATSEALERWLIESDLATLMASGLGALYSQLSRKLVVTFPEDSVPAVVTYSEATLPQIPHEADTITSPDFQSHLMTFLSYLVFWQDILGHCRSEDLRRSLLDHFKLLFLQQLLYPSLIESSDVDGGSSVAVLTYLRCIIQSIDDTELLYITLQYLLALSEKSEDVSKPARPTTLARRRKSSMLITNLAKGLEKPMPDLFTLVDLILTSLKSRNQQTVAATLRLISVILQSQHQYAVLSIIKTQPPSDDTHARTTGAHARDTEALFSMAEDLIEHGNLIEIYEAHLEDARTLVESHCCSASLLTLPSSSIGDANVETLRTEHKYTVQPHLIRLDDPLTNSMVALLGDFLTNDINTNLSLTQAVSTLASCGNTRLDRWLLGDPNHTDIYSVQSAAFVSESGDSDKVDTVAVHEEAQPETRTADMNKLENLIPNRSEPPHYHRAPSPMFAALDSLVQQVERFRHDIKDFDAYLAERRHVYKVGEDIDKAVANDSPQSQESNERRSGESTTLSMSRVRGADRITSISDRLISESASSNGSRSSSPRGRQSSDLLPSTPMGRLSHLRISPSPSPSQPASRTFSPSPRREEPSKLTPPKRVLTALEPTQSLHQKLKIKSAPGREVRDLGSSETSSLRSQSASAEVRGTDTVAKEISLGHLLTNVIILQEFILELAAIVEVRGSLFGEVKFI